jgi:hypothetical protein
MEDFIREHCKYWRQSFDELIRRYNSNEVDNHSSINFVIYLIVEHKIEHNKDIIYKEDILKIISKYYKKDMSQEEFMENVMRDIKYFNLDINNLEAEHCYNYYITFYHMSTFLEHEPVDIKIALKD